MVRKYFFYFCLVLLAATTLTACSDNDNDEDTEYANWQERNDAYFYNIRSTALNAIRQAKNTYGNAWQEHCNWRTYLCYSLDSTITNDAMDSIYVEILEQGEGSGCPLSTDSVRIFYRAHLIPSQNHSEGYIFSHSGQSSKYEEIFNIKTSVPSAMRPTGAIKGFGTALQQMHIGDLWRIYIPHPLGYKAAAQTGIPPYSLLIYETQLVSYYRRGAAIDSWR